ncbi:hypothetical protein ACLOJK_019415 [Asimina triloba]
MSKNFVGHLPLPGSVQGAESLARSLEITGFGSDLEFISGGKMADAVVSILLEKLVTFLQDEGRQLLEFEDRFDEIRNEFQYLQNYLKDVKRVKRRDRTETLKLIMTDVREVIYDAEEIIAGYLLLSQKKKQGWASSYLFTALSKPRYGLGRKLKDVNKRIKEVKQNMIAYLATVPAHGRNEVGEDIPLTYPILMTEDRIVGLEGESRKIIDWLLVKNEYLKVVGIVGMGGIGKTTLAEKIFKAEIIGTNFKHSIFVTVSQSFRFDELLKKMLKKLAVAAELLCEKGVDDLLEDLKNKLDGEYLIVLDDVWGLNEGQWWESLSSALLNVKGGCVMVTTRIEEVARSMGAIDERIYHPEILLDENSWSLFYKVAFARNGGISPNAELEMHGKDIVAQCGGLPLTIKTVGGMRMGKGYSINEWERISKHLKEEMTDSKKDGVVISRLKLSYEELPMHLRPCLLCFAMYPEDYEVDSTQIIGTWIAEGFVCGRKGKTSLQIGEECLNELRNRFLILKGEDLLFRSVVYTHKVHDIVREMLIKIATEESFFNMHHRDKPMASKLSRRVIIYQNMPQEIIENSNSSRLRTLTVVDTETVLPILVANLHKFRRGLVHCTPLVYLHLESVDALTTLPDSIGNLRNLQWLAIVNCCNLKSLPSSITRLEKLTVLRVASCESIECWPKGLGKLPNLEHLECLMESYEDVPNSWMSLSDLKQLKKLRRLFVDIGEEECNVLQIPESLQLLWLYFHGGVSLANAAEITRKIDLPLCHPLRRLEGLFLFFYPGENMPAWLSPTSLPNLRCLVIIWGSIKKLGPRFFFEWKVETLVLLGLEEFEEDWANVERVMPFLKSVDVSFCPKLKYSEEAFQRDPNGGMTWKKYDQR